MIVATGGQGSQGFKHGQNMLQINVYSLFVRLLQPLVALLNNLGQPVHRRRLDGIRLLSCDESYAMLRKRFERVGSHDCHCCASGAEAGWMHLCDELFGTVLAVLSSRSAVQ